MTFNLIREPWIPVITENGVELTIAPSDITKEISSSPLVGLNCARPDFNGALIQFLIGLVQASMAPNRDAEWLKYVMEPPTPDLLKKAFEPIEYAFDIDGKGPRFLQDRDIANEDMWDIHKLFLEMPGENTIKLNKDLFSKRGRISSICPSCAAMALYTIQTNSAGFGAGHRTSLRGGGPMSTIVKGRNLWEDIWFNVLEESSFMNYHSNDKIQDTDKFPWLTHTRTSGKGENETTYADVHPVQMFFGMPLRILLEFQQKDSTCDCCGKSTQVITSNFHIKNHGVNYSGPWFHPLSPYKTYKKNQDVIPIVSTLKVDSTSILYDHWLGIVQKDAQATIQIEPAKAISIFNERKERYSDEIPDGSTRLSIFGFELENGKARGWWEAQMPLITVKPELKEEYELIIAQLIRAANYAGNQTLYYTKLAMFKEPKNVKGDFNFIKQDFWKDSENAFYQTLYELKSTLSNSKDLIPLKKSWLKYISGVAETIFDRYSQVEMIGDCDPERIAKNRRKLARDLSSGNKKMGELLDLPLPPHKADREKNTGNTSKSSRV
jgi:CRISPR system Cascade subunit CasA